MKIFFQNYTSDAGIGELSGGLYDLYSADSDHAWSGRITYRGIRSRIGFYKYLAKKRVLINFQVSLMHEEEERDKDMNNRPGQDLQGIHSRHEEFLSMNLLWDHCSFIPVRSHTRERFEGRSFSDSSRLELTSRLKLTLFFSEPSIEEILIPIENREIIYLYSGTLAGTVPSYSLDEIMGEKIWSLFEGTRPRHLYDVYHLMPRVHKFVVAEVFHKKMLFT